MAVFDTFFMGYFSFILTMLQVKSAILTFSFQSMYRLGELILLLKAFFFHTLATFSLYLTDEFPKLQLVLLQISAVEPGFCNYLHCAPSSICSAHKRRRALDSKYRAKASFADLSNYVAHTVIHVDNVWHWHVSGGRPRIGIVDRDGPHCSAHAR